MKWEFGRAPPVEAASALFLPHRLHDPDEELALVLAIPIGASLGIAVLVLWILLAPWHSWRVETGLQLASLILLVPLHELAHAAAFPRPARGRLSVECSPTRMLFRAGYDAALSRNRLLWVLTAPFAVISLLPGVVAAATGGAPDLVAAVSVANALLSGGDGLAAILIFGQIPRQAMVRLDGNAIIWAPCPASHAGQWVGSAADASPGPF